MTPDFFPLPSADAESSGLFGFLTTSYGATSRSMHRTKCARDCVPPTVLSHQALTWSRWAGDMRWTGLPGSNTSRNSHLCYDYANYYIGRRPAPGAPFRPSLATSAPFDWSPFTPLNDTSSTNLTFAVSKGMQEFGCCPCVASLLLHAPFPLAPRLQPTAS